VERLMRADGMRARIARMYRPKAGTHRWFGQHRNHVRRTHATRPNQIWVGDLTYLSVGGRWWYLGAVLDQYSRRVLAWRLASTRDSRLTRAVVDAALRPPPADSRPHLSQRPRQRIPGHGLSHSSGRRRCPPEHDARRCARRERAHGVLLSLAEGRPHPRSIVSDGRRAPPAAPSLRTVLQPPTPAFCAGLPLAR
jgi:transposase InsO family protein